MSLRLHAIVLALNEEVFITNLLNTLYPFCAGISVLTQYDRDWYGKRVTPDQTVELVARHPDPEGKIHLCLRRWRDQAAALNSEIGALSSEPARGVMSHGTPLEEVRSFHRTPDYFWIVDADEFYDPATVPAMLALLERRRPRGMRVHGYNYVKTWNRRVPMETVRFCQFGFVRPEVRFVSTRGTGWNESRLSKLLGLLRLPDFSAWLFGFIECPKDVAVFHHACWIGDRDRLTAKAAKSPHTWMNTPDYPEKVATVSYELIGIEQLPSSIRNSDWPPGYLETTPGVELSLRHASASS